MTITIAASVGRGGANQPADVSAVGTALVAVGEGRGGAATTPSTLELLGGAIEAFQRFNRLMPNPDGRIDPGGATLKRLNQVLDDGASAAAITVTVGGFSQYRTGIADLPVDQQFDVERLAHAIVNSLLPGAPKAVSLVRVTGHADSDAQGPAFEMQVSVERASNALSYLQQRTKAIAIAKRSAVNRLDQIVWQALGEGAQRKVVPSPRSEDERAANRRVDLLMDFGPAVATQAHTWRDGLNKALDALQGRAESGPVRRTRCILNKLRDDPAAIDGWVNRHSLWLIPGSAGMPNLTPDQWNVAIPAIVSHVRADLSHVSAYGDAVPNDQVWANLHALDDYIGESIDYINSQSVADSATGVFHRGLMAWIGSQTLDFRSIYSCYAGYSRQHHED
jgi:hypothetical protein